MEKMRTVSFKNNHCVLWKKIKQVGKHEGKKVIKNSILGKLSLKLNIFLDKNTTPFDL